MFKPLSALATVVVLLFLAAPSFAGDCAACAQAVFTQPVVSYQQVVAQPVFAQPVLAQSFYSQAVVAAPVVSQRVVVQRQVVAQPALQVNVNNVGRQRVFGGNRTVIRVRSR